MGIRTQRHPVWFGFLAALCLGGLGFSSTSLANNPAASELPTLSSLQEKLASKRTAAQQAVRVAQAILRQTKHRAVALPGDEPVNTRDRFLLELIRRELPKLLADIATLEKAIAAAPDSQVQEIEELFENLDYREETNLNTDKKFAWPLAGQILSSPGSSLRQGGARWPGIFIQSEPESSVRAIAAGKVVFAGEMKHLGLLVIIDHQDGYLSLYGKNGKIFVATDDQVSDQQVIAKSDIASKAATSEFYFEIRRHGKTIDPRQVCAEKPSQRAAGN